MGLNSEKLAAINRLTFLLNTNVNEQKISIGKIFESLKTGCQLDELMLLKEQIENQHNQILMISAEVTEKLNFGG